MPIGETGLGPYAVPPPVAPHPELLPLGDPNLPWEGFEAFCEELISRLPGVKETHRYGKAGSLQRGVDIYADYENGERWAFQCKQRKRFAKTDVTRAIQKATYEADRFILMLSLEATSGVRDVCGRNPNWDVWDVGDISRKVKELKVHSGARLVEAHFGASWRKAFLGLHGLTSFVTPTEFFHQFQNASTLFNHTWELVGRTEHLRKAHEFVESMQQKVAILSGRGGIGKSKILHALSDTFEVEHKGMALWFASEGVPLTQSSADDLPFEPCIVIVDDAHRRDDLPALLALIRQRPHVTKLLLSCRPQALDYLKSQLTQGGFDVHQVADLPDVKELTREEVKELGRQALGPEFETLAERLADATWDCPLVTVVGGQLLAKKAIAPKLLERDEEFRGTVLTRFRDILVGDVSDRIDTTLCTSLLDLIAAVQPIRLDNLQLLDREAEFLEVDRPRLLTCLDLLESAGVLLRRGYTLRIVPDVLADHILHQANVTSLGQPTGNADLVFDRFASLCPGEVLRNLSELDWRLRRSGAPASSPLSSIWKRIEQGFQDAPNLGRSMTLGLLENVAAYQPERTLELVEYAIRNPATDSEIAKRAQLFGDTHGDVLSQLPALLRQISYTPDYLPRCCSLLWEMGRDDNRNLNSYPDHAMRVLADLGGYEANKPYSVTYSVLDAMEKLLEDPSSHNHLHSPLDIIDPMLAKTRLSVRSEGYKSVWRAFMLEYERIKSIRRRALSLLERCLFSTNLRVSLRAFRGLGGALDEPKAYLNMKISDEDREQWRAEQLEILNLMADFTRRSAEPVKLIRIRDVLGWHCNFSSCDEVRDLANSVVSSISDSFELRLTQALMNPYHMDCWPPNEDNGEDGNGPSVEKSEQTQRAIADELFGRSENASEAYEILADRIQVIHTVGVQSNPQVFLGTLGDSAPDFAADLCEIIVDNPDGPLKPYFQSLLTYVRNWSAERARGIGDRALKGGSAILCRGVAWSYQSRRWADSATAEDIEIIKDFLDQEDLEVRRLAIGSLRTLAETDLRVALDLAKRVELGDHTNLAIALCQIFQSGQGIQFGELTPDDLNCLLSQLENVQEIEDFHINAFLVKASEQDAWAVVDFLLARIRKEVSGGENYHALPILGFRDPLLGLSTNPEQETILRKIRDLSLEREPIMRYWLPELFAEVSSDFDSDTSLQVLNEWINSTDVDKIESAVHLVSGAQPEFVFKHVEFVSNLLERAFAKSLVCYRSAASSLSKSAVSGARSGTPGQPRPEDEAMREHAAAAASQFDKGSPTFRFYSSLTEIAEASIKDDLLRDEERFE